MQSKAKTVADYLAELSPERREAISRVRDVIREHLPEGYEEGMQFGMITWCVPLSRYPDTYNGRPLGIAALASQKQSMSVYLMSVYGDPDIEAWFVDAWQKTGKKLDMGKSCVRFRKVDDLALDVLAQTVAKLTPEEFIARYEAVKGISGKKPSTRTVRSTKASPAKKR